MTDDRLSRYVDGELDATGSAAVEAAMANDPAVRASVGRQRALRNSAAVAFDDVLAEPVPLHLIAALRPMATVSEIAPARERRNSRMGFVQRWGALAAMLVAGLLGGRALAPLRPAPLTVDAALARGLDGRNVQAIALGLSYRDRGGQFCRVFRDDRAAPAAGIACRATDGWALRVVAAANSRPAGAYRAASGDLPPAVTATLDSTIAGSALDAAGEADASRRGWQR